MTCTWRSIARSLLPYTVSLRRFCASAHLHLHCAPSPSQLPDSCYTRKLVDAVVPSYSLGQKAAFVYLILLSMSMSMSMSTWTWTLISIGSWHTFPNQAVASSPVHGRFLFSSLTCSPAHQRAHRSGIDYIARRRWFNVSDTAGGSIILFLTSSQQPCLSLVALLAHHGPGDTTIGHLDSRYSKSPDHGSPIRTCHQICTRHRSTQASGPTRIFPFLGLPHSFTSAAFTLAIRKPHRGTWTWISWWPICVLLATAIS